jgi:epoxyqueuosine reductase
MLREFFEREGISCFEELEMDSFYPLTHPRWQRIGEELGEIASVVVFLIPYYSGQKTGNISVYAQPRDYHWYMKELTQRFREECARLDPALRAVGAADTSPLDERDAALKAGLGVLGDHGLVIHPHFGSFCFIGAFFLNRAISPKAAGPYSYCSHCGACVAACPTGAIGDPDRRLCLSLLTQKKNRTEEEDRLVRESACKWGCDLCQNVCPMNRDLPTTPISFFREDLVRELDEEALSAPKEEFSRRAYAWRGRELLRKNLEK